MDADRSTPPSTGAEGPAEPGGWSEAGDSITVVTDGGATIVRIRGDIDAVTAPALRCALLEVLDRRPERVRIDMAGVEFLDSVGISVLVSAYNRAEDAGIGFELAAVPGSSRRVLEITRLTEVFTIVD